MGLRSAAVTGAGLLSLEGVCKTWGKAAVLRDTQLRLGPGEVACVVGGNGAGKTTLLRIATGVIAPDRGSVRFRGSPIEDDLAAFRRRIGFLSAGDRGLYARLTVRQNLDFWGGLATLHPRRRRERIADVLRDFELGELAGRRVDRLSMGQRQRVRLALTFLHEPTVIFLDEPTTSLDASGIGLLHAALERLLAAGGGVVWASPEPELPFRARVYRLEAGRLRPLATAARSAPSPAAPDVAVPS